MMILCGLAFAGCETAQDTAEGAGHAVAKTGHVIEHGGEKLEDHTE